MGWQNMELQRLLFAAGGAAGVCAALYCRSKGEGNEKTGATAPTINEITKVQLQQILEEVIKSQEQLKGYMKDLLSQNLSFEQTYLRVREVQPSDPLEKYGLSTIDFHHLLEKHQSDSNVQAAIAKIVGGPHTSSSVSEKVLSTTVKKIVDVHQFMLEELDNMVKERNYEEAMRSWGDDTAECCDLHGGWIAAQELAPYQCDSSEGWTDPCATTAWEAIAECSEDPCVPAAQFRGLWLDNRGNLVNVHAADTSEASFVATLGKAGRREVKLPIRLDENGYGWQCGSAWLIGASFSEVQWCFPNGSVSVWKRRVPDEFSVPLVGNCWDSFSPETCPGNSHPIAAFAATKTDLMQEQEATAKLHEQGPLSDASTDIGEEAASESGVWKAARAPRLAQAGKEKPLTSRWADIVDEDDEEDIVEEVCLDTSALTSGRRRRRMPMPANKDRRPAWKQHTDEPARPKWQPVAAC